MNTPTPEQEVNRKFVNALYDLSVHLTDGRITQAQFDSGLNGAFAVASGFLKEDVLNLLSDMSEMVDHGDDSFHPRSIWVNDKGTVLVIESNLPDQQMIAWMAKSGRVVARIPWSELSMREAQVRIVAIVESKGYKRVLCEVATSVRKTSASAL